MKALIIFLLFSFIPANSQITYEHARSYSDGVYSNWIDESNTVIENSLTTTLIYPDGSSDSFRRAEPLKDKNPQKERQQRSVTNNGYAFRYATYQIGNIEVILVWFIDVEVFRIVFDQNHWLELANLKEESL